MKKHQVYKGPFKKIEATFQKKKAMGYFFLKKHFHFWGYKYLAKDLVTLLTLLST